MRNSTKRQKNSKKHTVKHLEFLVKFWHAEGSISKYYGANSNEIKKRTSRNGPNPHSMDGTHLIRIRIKPDASEALD